MKKLLLMIAAVATLAFTSCDKAAQGGDEVAAGDSINVENVEALLLNADSANVEGVFEAIKAKAEDLKAAGDTVAANGLLAKVQEVIDANKEKLAAIIPAAQGLNLDVKAAVDSVAGAAKDAAAEVVDAAKEKAADAANAAVDAAKEKAADAVNAGAEKAADAAKGAAADAKKKLGL